MERQRRRAPPRLLEDSPARAPCDLSRRIASAPFFGGVSAECRPWIAGRQESHRMPQIGHEARASQRAERFVFCTFALCARILRSNTPFAATSLCVRCNCPPPPPPPPPDRHFSISRPRSQDNASQSTDRSGSTEARMHVLLTSSQGCTPTVMCDTAPTLRD